MDSYSLHLIMAALVRASFVAVCDLFMHRKMFSDLIELAKARELESQRDNEDAADDEVSPRHSRPVSYKRRIQAGGRSGEARRGGLAFVAEFCQQKRKPNTVASELQFRKFDTEFTILIEDFHSYKLTIFDEIKILPPRYSSSEKKMKRFAIWAQT